MLPMFDLSVLFLRPMLTLAVFVCCALWLLLVVICVKKLEKKVYSEQQKNKVRSMIKGAFLLIALSWVFFLATAYMSLGWFAPWLIMVTVTVVLGTAIFAAGKGILYAHDSTASEG